MGTPPSVFLCYRRADEPFAAALLGVTLQELLGAGNVFLDTLSLRSRVRFEAELLGRAGETAVLLVLAGKSWDRGENRARLTEDDDWVRREIRTARAAGARIVVVRVEREAALDPPPDLGFLRDCEAVPLARPHLAEHVRAVAERVAPGLPVTVALDRDTVQRAALAMVRHVLPGPQQSLENDRTIARAVAGELGPGEWLRFAGAGRSRTRRPRGSGIVLLTDGEVRLVELGEAAGPFDTGIRTIDVTHCPLRPGTTVELTPARLLWSARADVHVRTPGHPPLSVLGMFPDPARLLRALATPDGRA
ncbi:toll/interleukin-1 receptor domain-containing protein [Pseudonocardia humida]|uniref:Toll/interleukin-1 receptor domain-containing protein n=1 Tax=Pseudonocardia humida TaxID=2800819 RepID=A0ABT0ZZQ6_9PSEU|nr:toll/interleukin-1 receptor domain-containing protein [Pseudonocardia humida]MCO1656236.1 toll/interleukin-1 receptor domain-containing protein [Pseudonocardia humida]